MIQGRVHASDKTAEEMKSHDRTSSDPREVPKGTPRLRNTAMAVGARSRPETN